jgi:PadR family transcriptional regulator, regulatory protein PadR
MVEDITEKKSIRAETPLLICSMHGYGISVRIAGSLFLAIERLERAGLIDGEWKPTENNRRAKYYTLTQKGRKRLDNERREWGRQVAAIARILEA